MAKKFSLTSLMDTDKIIYIAPILIFASLFHIFSSVSTTHNFGQIEILAALIIVFYYLWDKIAVIYTPDKIGKKRIEAVVFIVISIFLALVPLPFLLSWQYYNLYNASDRYSYSKQILVAVISVWLGIGILYFSAYSLMAERMAAGNAGLPQSTMPTPAGAP